MSQNKQITLDNLTSALKAVYGQNTEVPLLIFRHWAARDYDMAQATPECAACSIKRRANGRTFGVRAR
jgi:hypothetical protein